MLQRFVWYECRPIAQLQIRFMRRKKTGSLWNRWRGEARQVALMQPGLPSFKVNFNQFVLHKFPSLSGLCGCDSRAFVDFASLITFPNLVLSSSCLVLFFLFREWLVVTLNYNLCTGRFCNSVS
jgi:hypothetical protein